MTAQTAIGQRWSPFGKRLRLPPRVPPFNTGAHWVFSALWVAALLIAVLGPSLALYDRYRSAADNSQLLLGSRAGFAVSLADATEVRFLVGPASREAGLREGDDIVAIFGLPLPETMPMTDAAIAQHVDDPAYIAMGTLFYGTDEMPVPLTVRSPGGNVRDVTLVTSEAHINEAAREHGFSPTLLSFIDVVHVIFYPFLIWAAWILHRRNSRDAVSSVLSLAILLTIATELPSSAYLATLGIPRPVLVGVYDVANILLLAGILLFPHGRLTPVVVALLAATPLLMLLRGGAYQSYFLMLFIAAVLVQIRSLRTTEAIDVRQQIRWALFGFSGYAIFRAIAYAADIFKWSTGSFSAQLGLEVAAGLSFGLSVLILQLGLLVALVRYRLYDAEAVISRTASVAMVTLAAVAIFAGVMEGIIETMQNIYPNAEREAAMAGAIVATVFIHPLHQRIEKWTERRFQKTLFELQETLPEMMRDTRDSARLDDFLREVLGKIVTGVNATRGAVVLDDEVKQTAGVTAEEVEAWLARYNPQADRHALDCVPTDHVFPLRLEVETSAGAFGWLLIGPRPDGSIPGGDEQEALEKIAATLGRSIRIVLTREEAREELLRLLDAHGDRISRMERLLKIAP